MTSYARNHVEFPTVTICGSMRFAPAMLTLAEQLTAAGHVVLMPFVVVTAAEQDTSTKAMLDRMHRQKIDASSTVYIVSDAANYIGDSTRAEIRYAKQTGKRIEWWTIPSNQPSEAA